MTIMARYSGVCPQCGERWQPGDLIRACANPTETGAACWHHASCPNPEIDRLIEVRPGEVSCRRCFLIHPEGECDR